MRLIVMTVPALRLATLQVTFHQPHPDEATEFW
jgi:hypothetical protein